MTTTRTTPDEQVGRRSGRVTWDPTRRRRSTVPVDEPVDETVDDAVTAEVEDAVEDAVEDPAPPAARSRRGAAVLRALAGRGRLVATVTGVLLVAAIAVSTTLWLRLDHAQDQRDAARASNLSPSTQGRIVKQATKYAVDLTTYDYRDLAAQQKKLAAESTPKFQTRFASTEQTLNSLFTSLEALAQGSVADAAVKSTGADSAVVLLFVNQKASSNKVKAPQPQYTRVRMTLKSVHGTWLLDQVDLV